MEQQEEVGGGGAGLGRTLAGVGVGVMLGLLFRDRLSGWPLFFLLFCSAFWQELQSVLEAWSLRASTAQRGHVIGPVPFTRRFRLSGQQTDPQSMDQDIAGER